MQFFTSKGLNVKINKTDKTLKITTKTVILAQNKEIIAQIKAAIAKLRKNKLGVNISKIRNINPKAVIICHITTSPFNVCLL